jgi:hypothetical protein
MSNWALAIQIWLEQFFQHNGTNEKLRFRNHCQGMQKLKTIPFVASYIRKFAAMEYRFSDQPRTESSFDGEFPRRKVSFVNNVRHVVWV